jgi:hypothetical protein
VLLLVVGPPLRWVSDHPLRTAAGVASLLAAGVVLSSLGVTVGPTGVELAPLTTDRLLRFSLERPAYPVAVVVGLGVLLFWR